MKNEKNENVTEVENKSTKNYGGNKNTKNRSRNKNRKVKSNTDCNHDYNDMSWYNKNPQLIKDTASIPFKDSVGNRLGISNNKFDVTVYDGANPITTYDRVVAGEYAPGIAILNFIPGIGHSVDGTSAANMAASNIYSYVRFANSGAKNYDAPDLMQYLLAADSAYMMYEFVKRLIGLVNVYSAMNRYVPLKIFEGLRADYKDIARHLPQLRAGLNNFVVKMNALYVPNTMDLFNRHQWMCANVYADSPTSRAQLYLFRPEGFYLYDETVEQGQLKFTELNGPRYGNPEKGYTLNTEGILTMLDDIVTSIIECETFKIMGGDILKAFGSNNMRTIGPVEETYSVLPVYTPEVLLQIENARFVGPLYEIQNRDITSNPDTGLFIYAPVIKRTFTKDHKSNHPANVNVNAVFNFHMDTVTPDLIVEASRLQAGANATNFTVKSATETEFEYELSSFGTEICTTMDLIFMVDSYSSNGVQSIMSKSEQYSSFMNGRGALYPETLAQRLAIIDKFNYHPQILVFDYTYCKCNFKDIIMETDNVSVISTDQLSSIHDVALLSLFGVPYRG